MTYEERHERLVKEKVLNVEKMRSLLALTYNDDDPDDYNELHHKNFIKTEIGYITGLSDKDEVRFTSTEDFFKPVSDLTNEQLIELTLSMIWLRDLEDEPFACECFGEFEEVVLNTEYETITWEIRDGELTDVDHQYEYCNQEEESFTCSCCGAPYTESQIEEILKRRK